MDGDAFFTTAAGEPANNEDGDLQGDLVERGQSITVVTDNNGDADYYLGIKGSDDFDDDGEAALADLVTVMGQPIGDPGWGPDDRCTTPEVRRLGWGGLEVVLSRMAAGGPTLLAQWYLTGQDSDATSLWTLERIGIGSTVGDLRAAHGGQITLERPSDRDPAGWFDTEPLLGDGIRGAVGNTSDAGRVLLMWAGEGCQRRFG